MQKHPCNMLIVTMCIGSQVYWVDHRHELVATMTPFVYHWKNWLQPVNCMCVCLLQQHCCANTCVSSRLRRRPPVLLLLMQLVAVSFLKLA